MKILLIFICLIIILYTPLRIEIKLYRKNNNNDFIIKILPLYDISKIQINIPIVKLVNYSKKLPLRIKSKVEIGKNEKDIFVDKNLIAYKKLIRIYKNILVNRKYLIELGSYIMKNLEIEKIFWISSIGFGDASLTAIMSGVLLQVKSLIISYLLNIKEVKKINFIVYPVYQTKTLDLVFNCIIKVKFVHIIIAGIKGLKLLKLLKLL